MRTALLLLSVSAIATGCIVYDDGGPPVIIDSNAPAGFDVVAAEIDLGTSVANDWLYLDAEVYDPDGIGDISVVFVEIYDDYTGLMVDTFDLVPTTSFLWQADIPIRDTYLVPDFYPDYSIDFWVQDWQGEGEVVTILPDLYY